MSVKSELTFTLFLSVITILFSASAIYYLENEPNLRNFLVSQNLIGGRPFHLLPWVMVMSIQ